MKEKLGLASALVIAGAAVINVAGAQTAPTPPAATEAETGSEVIVTGTRRTDRTVAESAAPIDVLSGADLDAQPTGNMLDSLSNLVPSFIVGQNSISDASSFVRSPSLRGLAGDEMLVMLNGKRMNRSALVQVYQGGETELAFGAQGPDLASIPTIAVKDLEILRDGASAQYGSDAIAGVLNYQFKNDNHGVEVTGRLGQYFPKDYKDDGGDGQVAFNLGLPLGSQGFADLAVEVARNAQTIRNPTRPSAVAFANVYPNLAPDLPNYPGPVQEWGTPPSKSVKAFLNTGIKLDNDDQVYFFGNYARINSNESFNYRLPTTVTYQGTTYANHPAFNTIYTQLCTADPACAGGYLQNGTTFNFSSIYPGGFTPRFFGETEEFYGALGYKGVNRWGVSYDLSGTTATNSLALSLKRTINPSLGPSSPTDFYDGKFVQNESNFNLDLSYPWSVPWLDKPISIAGGAEYRYENYKQLLGDPASYAAGQYASQRLYTCVGAVCTQTGTASQSTASNGYGGISAPVDAGEASEAGYVDLEADLTPQLTVGLAGRYEHYASFGSTELGKFQVRFAATDWLALRGTVSNGFHAPSPGQSNVETLSTTFIPGTTTQVQIGTYPVTSSIAQFYGAVPLKPEKATNLSAGLVLTPVSNLLVTLDAYRILVSDRIGISQTYNVTTGDIAQLSDLSYVGAGGTVQYFTNGFDTITKGVDLVGTYSFTLGDLGRFYTTVAYNYNKTDVTKYDPQVITTSRIIDIQHYAPNNRVNLTAAYSIAGITATLHENYYGTYRDQNDYPGQLFSAKYTTDIDLAYNVWKDITVAVGGKNIFNAMPDVVEGVSPLTGGLQDGERYPRTGGPFGFNGAFWYFRFAAKLF